jgi:hypothetical protein
MPNRNPLRDKAAAEFGFIGALWLPQAAESVA